MQHSNAIAVVENDKMSDVCGQKIITTETDDHKARRMQLRQNSPTGGKLAGNEGCVSKGEHGEYRCYWFDTVDVLVVENKVAKCRPTASQNNIIMVWPPSGPDGQTKISLLNFLFSKTFGLTFE